MTRTTDTETIRAWWNGRAALGPDAGTQDVLLRTLERDTLGRWLLPGRALDVGCGNGDTARWLTEQYPGVAIDGFDFAPALIAVAQREGGQRVRFAEGDVTQDTLPQGFAPPYQTVYTQRCLINLPDWPTQRAAIQRLAGWVAPGGRLVLVESCLDGVAALNRCRGHVGLPAIVPPWHNRYLQHAEVASQRLAGMRFVDAEDFSSTYYFLSRVVNAALAAQAGQEPDYEAPVNHLALRLPPWTAPGYGQTRAWVWARWEREA